MRTILLAALVAAAPATAAEPLTLDRVFASPDLSGPRPRLAKLSPDGRFATLLKSRPDDRDRFDLWAIDTATGAERMLVDSTKLATGAELSEAEKMRRERARLAGVRGIVDYAWAPDATRLLVPVDGDLFLAGLDGGVQRLTEAAATETDAKVSPKGRYVSFVRDQNLHVLTLAGGATRALTTDGGGTLSWGVAEFVAQEEMDRTDGHWWSPDDTRLAVARVDESRVLVVPRAAIGAEGTRVYEQRYPKAGTPNATVELWLMNPDGSGRVKADLGSDSDIYLARVDWTPDGRAVLVQRQSRDQKRLDVLRIDATTGAATTLFTETSPTWINLHDDLKPLKDGSLLWTSERSGMAQVYRWRAGRWTQLTDGALPVDKIAGVDEAKGKLFFTAFAGAGATEKHLYAARLDRRVTPTRLTQAAGWHDVDMDKRGTRALVTAQSPEQPPQTYLADASGTRLAWLVENRLDATHPYAPFRAGHVAPRFGTLKAADGVTDLAYRLLVPPQLKAGERAPVLMIVYGGPGTGRQARRVWGSNLVDQYFARKGWVVFSVDNRGSPNRGKRFEDALHRAMGGVEVADQLAALDWLTAQPFVDAKRVGVYGWSYGGYMTLRLLAAAPGRFAGGVSGAPVTQWGLYDTHYTERYLGNPAIDPAPYAASDVIPVATQIRDPLLLIHGMADDNVIFQHSTSLMATLQGARLPFETMVYPGQTHALSTASARVFNWMTIERFLDRAVKASR
ncbi:MAG: S9 family peptidase [Alphaproteobacteria bacterium]|nr:S9 family peptidase [Alphaproteobacteria bacterium]